MEKTTLEAWTALVRKSPNHAALIRPDGCSISRSDLDEKSDLLSREWIRLGMKPHRMLALNLTNGPDWMIAFLACLKLKAIVVPFDPGISSGEAIEFLSYLEAQALWDGTNLIRGTNQKVRTVRNKFINICKLTSNLAKWRASEGSFD